MAMMDSYFPHEATTSSDLRMIKLIDTLGAQGYGAYWFIMEHLRLQHDYMSSIEILGYLARQIKCRRELINRLITEFGLFVIEGSCFFSADLIARMEPLEEKRKSMIERAKAAAKAKWEKYNEEKQPEETEEDEDAHADAQAETTEMHTHMPSKVEQSTAEQSKHYISPSLPPQGEDITPFWKKFTPPPYALNKKTHNFSGLVFQLNQLQIDDPKLIKTILSLADYGKLGGPFWWILHKRSVSEWRTIKNPGVSIVRSLKKYVAS